MAKGKKIQRQSKQLESSERTEAPEFPEQFKPQHELIEELIDGLKAETER